MNSYGDPSSARGRANIPGQSPDHGPEADPWGSAPAAGAYRASASAGSGGGWGANGGHEPTPPRAAPTGGRASVGSAPAGRATVGRAGIPSPAGPGPDESFSAADRPAGRAVVGAARVGAAGSSGRAAVARASVRPVSPGGPGAGGGAGGGPNGPGGKGPGGGRGGNDGRGGGKGDPADLRKAKKRKRMNLIIAAFAVVIMVMGVGVVGFTWFSTTVKTPTDFAEPIPTTIMYSNGKQLAKLGQQNRTIVPWEKINPDVRHAVMAAEDKNFENHGGIDMKGIARAAWNNFTGGTTQGASTITQQYARHVADLSGINYARKLREAVLASKLEQDFSKDQLLGFYLNAIYFGRGAHGVEAAAQAYFGKSVTTPPGQKGAMTPEEAAVLASVIKQPEPDANTGHKGYDPQLNPGDAQERWTYTMNNMQEKGWIAPEKRAAAKYPAVQKWDPKKNCATNCGLDTPSGNVVNYVRSELEAKGITNWKEGGYRITTTIDQRAQAAAENAARQSSKSSPMNKLPKNYMAALVAIDPSNGRVLAYYGGDNASGTDYAGLNTEPDGRVIGGHAPGSTFKVYTLAAALKAGISVDSHWDATKTKDPETEFEISNADRTNLNCENGGKWCSLDKSTVESYNVPFYWITKLLGPDKVVEAARDAGIRTMFTDRTERVDLATAEPSKVAPAKFDKQVGYGQYAVTVLDHANGMATLANRGVYNKAHFIVSVEKYNQQTSEWEKQDGEQRKPKKVFEANQMDDLNSVLKKIPGGSNKNLKNGRQSVGKTGTWELDKRDNGDAWMIGATPQIASAVWVGTTGNRTAIREVGGSPMFGGGTPAAVWKKFMDDAHTAMKLKEETFPDKKGTGDPNYPEADGVSPSPVAPKPEENKPCTNPLQLFCPPGSGENRGGGTNPNPGDVPNPGGNQPNPGLPPGGGNPGGGNAPFSGRNGGTNPTSAPQR
ncbi:transglycosylase domain-containing protein [Micromonospora sp. NPDC049679]|uniref:transglycosylase domain-containing protein n=1 Tax=Micromonospora sp. NPDC049679 TaxID=3155920 RepID=UPI0033FE9901